MKKILIFILLFLIILALNVFAVDVSETVINTILEDTNCPADAIILYRSSSWLAVFPAIDNMYMVDSTSIRFGDSHFNALYYDIDNGSFIQESSTSVQTFIDENLEIIYSDKDVYTDSSCTEVFFSAPGLPLVETMEQVEPTILVPTQVVLPLMTMMVGLVAFYKVWMFLTKSLRGA